VTEAENYNMGKEKKKKGKHAERMKPTRVKNRYIVLIYATQPAWVFLK